MEYTLDIKDLSKSYSDFTLNHIDFQIPKGVIMGLIGENGAGKSTIINLLLNEIKKESGSIHIFGKDMDSEEKAIKQHIGVVFDECNFIETFKVKHLNTIFKDVYTAWDEDLYFSYIQRFDLPQNKKIKAFSKGMKVKLSFAVALAHHPKFLVLDEATSGLDPVMRDEILDILQEFIQDEEHTVLLSSHITSDLEKIADYIAFIHKGNILFSKPKDELLYEYGILRCGKEIFSEIDPEDIVTYRKEDYEWKVLVNNKEEAMRKYPQAVMDQPTIDDIMLFYIKGEVKA